MRIFQLLAYAVTPFALLTAGTALASEPGGTEGDAEPQFEAEISQAQDVGDESWQADAAEGELDSVERGIAAPEATPAAMDPEPMQAPAMPQAVQTPGAETGIALGQIGYDADGNPGRIHVVVRGDTLWDISDAYLGTPWVWPSIWQDNRDIQNPHVIHPQDRIWITPTEMRRLTREEANAMLAAQPAAQDEAPLMAAPEPMQLPQNVLSSAPAEGRTHPVSDRESVGLVSVEALESSASIVRSVQPRSMLAQGDEVYIGLGEGEVRSGDQFTVFRVAEPVHDPDTGMLLGYHVMMLGWVEVNDVHPETALAEVRMSNEDMEVGDRIAPRELIAPQVTLQATPIGVDGKLSFFPKGRVMVGLNDYVYLNRGSLDGLEEGSPLEVYRPGQIAMETARGERVHVPDRIVAQMIVVKSTPESAAALIMHSEGELEVGDRFRGARP